MARKNSDASLSILAFVEDKITKELLTSLSIKHPELNFQVHEGGAKEAKRYLQSHPSSHILLIDLSKSKLALSDMHELSDVCVPGVEVICIGEKDEVGLFRDLIDLGVRDYIVKPLTVSLLVDRLQKLTDKKKQGSQESAFIKHGKTIAFIGVKGGIGTSTLAANCAWILAEKAAKKLSLIDLDLKYGMLGQFFNLPSSQRFTEVLESGEKIDEDFIELLCTKYSEHLSIVSSLESLNLYPKVKAENIEQVLHHLRKNFNYIVYDLPRDFSQDINLKFLEQADIITLVTDLTIFSLRDTIRILEYLWNERKNSHQRIVLVANRVGEYKHGELSQQNYEETIKQKIDVILPFDREQPLTAMNEDVLLASLKGALPQALYKLTSVLIEKEIAFSSFTLGNKSFLNYLFTNKE